ncbi:peptidase S8/S53 domain-containing protein [Panaeolus papilionaceus]|nr:peptidase S8/S53 domain-containing protein [Panaeolus papilionaceus]
MRLFTAILLAVALVAPTLASPTIPLREVERFKGQTTGKYIVNFKKGASRSDWAKKLKVTEDWDLVNGFAAELDEATLNALRASKDVATQTNAPWGLQRISQRAKLSSTSTTLKNFSALTYTYDYDASAGSGVDIYIVDTGIYTAHSDFGGRARWGASFNNLGGTAAGSRYGVAKAANLIAVKVLSDSSSGATSGIAKASGRPSVVSMSLGGSAATALDNAVASLTAGGVHVVVAAGNSNTDPGSTSPARAPSAITVGASAINDARSSFSNYGSVVDVFAPGTGITSTWIGSTTATNNISGTFMASPHIAGLVAYLIGKDGNVSPAAMEAKIKSLSTRSALTSVPSSTVNYLAFNGITA